MTHDDLVEKVTEVIATGFCCDRACGGKILDCGCKCEARVAIAIVLEEAAKVAEQSPDSHWGPTIAAEIRKLKGDA